jgi:hypothetical protein
VNGGSSCLCDVAFGQTFIATASEHNVRTVSFRWGDALNRSHPDPTITVLLRSGAGFSGEVLASQTVTSIPDNTTYETWIDFTFPNRVILSEDETYTLQFLRVNRGLVSGSFITSALDPYAAGTALVQKPFPGREVVPNSDIAFRVLSSEVTEPNSFMFGIITFAVAGLNSRRSR